MLINSSIRHSLTLCITLIYNLVLINAYTDADQHLQNFLMDVIYPIPKPGDWNLELNKMRPITLLECPRKLYIKILTNRLSKILSYNKNVLKDNNFAALPGKSTIEPIHILNNIMEDARENNKEL